MNEFLAQLSIALIPVIATGLTALVGVGIAYLSGLVKRQFGEQVQAKTNEYLGILEDVANAAVVNLQQSTVDRLKASGAWNEETARAVKADAVRLALETLGTARGRIEAQLKVDVPRYMESLIEVALRGLKEQ